MKEECGLAVQIK